MMSFPPDYFAGKKVTVMGLGHFGGQIAVVKYLVSQGAAVTVTDVAPPEKLKKALTEIQSLPVTLHLGGHLEADFTETDLIAVSPAVPKDSRYLKLAAQNGIPLTCEMNLFLDRCRGKVIAVTGTVGKSTTLAMLEGIFTFAESLSELSRLGYRKFWWGGNIGKSLLEDLPLILSDDLILLELSSFQLEDLAGIEYSPHIGLVTNIHPNHLDRHGTLESYADAKANITRFQQAGDFLITRAEDEYSEKIRELAPGHVKQWEFGTGGEERLKVRLVDGENGQINLEYRREESGLWEKILGGEELHVPGEHNLYNAAGAVAVAVAAGLAPEIVAEGLRRFKGLPDRLQLVGQAENVRWFNDSKSTTAEAGIVALKAFPAGTIFAIAGGYDKGTDLSEFARELAHRCIRTFCLGQTGPTLAEAIRKNDGEARDVGSLEEAVLNCSELVRSGQVVLLSPGCASWDMFENYQERGRQFTELVQKFLQNKEACALQATSSFAK
jgi:UDP-N-acetylmuramoylalanine--D-glutamate ligase